MTPKTTTNGGNLNKAKGLRPGEEPKMRHAAPYGPKNEPTVIDRIMNEVALYGGIPLHRFNILKLAKEHLGPEDSKEPFGAQYFAFHGPALPGVEPWTLEAARKLMSA